VVSILEVPNVWSTNCSWALCFFLSVQGPDISNTSDAIVIYNIICSSVCLLLYFSVLKLEF